MLNVVYVNLSESDLVKQANADMDRYEAGGTYSVVRPSDLQAIEKHLQRAEFMGTAGGKEARLRAQQILTRDAGIKFEEKPSMIQERQGIVNQRQRGEVLEMKANRGFRRVGKTL